jgi:hypothetical protein
MMRRIVGPGSSRPLLVLLVIVLLFAFTPISRVLLRAVNGSFAPTPYSSLALGAPSDAAVGFLSGERVPIKLTNRTGHTEAYHWRATQNGALISLGEDTLENGRASTIFVPSRGALTGKLQIALTGTNVFVTVPIRKR